MSAAEVPQYMLALDRANEVRLARAEVKRAIFNGTMTVGEVVLEIPACCENMTVGDLLMSQRRWGHSRARKLLAQIPVGELKPVGKLTQRQALEIRRLLDPDALPVLPVVVYPPVAD